MSGEEAELLRVFVGEADRHEGRPLYEAIVKEARAFGLAGATVLRGTLGFGRDSRIHTAKVLRIAEDLPMVVEIVDSPERIAAFIPVLRGVAPRCLATIERVRVVAAGAGAAPQR